MNYKEQIQAPNYSTDSTTSQASDYSTDSTTSQSEPDESTASETESTSTAEEDEERKLYTNMSEVKLKKDKDSMWRQLKGLENQTFLQNKAIWEAVELQQRKERKKIYKKLKELESRINMQKSYPDTQPRGDVCHLPKSGRDPILPNTRSDANWRTTSAYQLPCPSDLSSSVLSNWPQTPPTPTHLPILGSVRTVKQKNQVFPDTKQTYAQSSGKATYSAGERRRIRKAHSRKSGLPCFLPARDGVEKKEVDYALFCKSVHQSSPLPKTKECTVPLPAHRDLSEEKLKKDTDTIWRELKQLENQTLLQHKAIWAAVESKRQEIQTEFSLQQKIEKKKIYQKLKTLESRIDMQRFSPDAQPKWDALLGEATPPPTPQTPDQDDTASACHHQMSVHSNPNHSLPDARTAANWRRKAHSLYEDNTCFSAHQSTSAYQLPCLPDSSNFSSSMLSNRPQTLPTPTHLPIPGSIHTPDRKKLVLGKMEEGPSKSGEERRQALFELKYSSLIQCPLPNEDGMERKEVASALDCRSGRPLPHPLRATESTAPSEVQRVKQPRSLPCSPMRVNKISRTRKPHIISSESGAQEDHNEKDMEWKSQGQIDDKTQDMPPTVAEIELLKGQRKTVKSFHEETNADTLLFESQKKVKDLDTAKQTEEAKQLQRKNRMILQKEKKERAMQEERQQKEENLKLHEAIRKEKLKLQTLIRKKTEQKEMEERDRRKKKKLEKLMLERQKNTEAERNKIKEREKKEREKQDEIILEREKQAQKKTKKIKVREKKEKERQDQIILEKEKQAGKERQKMEERERKKKEKQEKYRLKREHEKEKERIKILKKAKKEKENEEKRLETELNKRKEQQNKMEEAKLEAQAKALKKERKEREHIIKKEEKYEKKKEKKERKELEKRQKKRLKREKERAHLELALQKIKNAEMELRKKEMWKNRGAKENLEQNIEKELELQRAIKKMEEEMDNKKKEKSKSGWRLPKVSVRIRSWSEMFPKKNKGDRKNI